MKNRPRVSMLPAFAVAIWLALVAPTQALTLPPGFSEELIGGGWNEPVGIAFDPSPQRSGRAYVWERGGRVWIVENGVKLATPLIDLSDEVGAWRDFGMLGLTLHPNFSQNGYIYLSYVVDRYHLFNAGKPGYDPAANQYFAATIGRVVRYTARADDDFRSVDPASRLVLIGESKGTGFPILYQSHGMGQLAFGTDGTLLASCGETSDYDRADDGSDPAGTYAAQGLADGIIQPKELVGAFRAQLVDSLSGKIVRINPETGDGVPGNPFFDPANPRAPRSRVWTLGLRNPFRFTVWPGTGSHDPADTDPGVIVLGDVGWGAYEEIDVIDGPARNCGWPLFEGLSSHESYRILNVENPDALNPLGGFFKFRDLIVQETLATPSWPNPLDPAQQIPANVPHFMHLRPIIDIGHDIGQLGPARAAIFHDTTAAEIQIDDPSSPVSGPQFGANATVAGTFYSGDDFPASYRGTYFHADFGRGWIKNFVFDANRRLTRIDDFASGGRPVFVATHPTLGCLYCVDFSDSTVRKITYAPGGNRAPKAAATADVKIGASPLVVTFSSDGSLDPDGLPLLYSWDFGDGTTSSDANPSHTFTSANPQRFDVTLIVTDAASATAQADVSVFVNDMLPQVELLSPIDGTKYPLAGDAQYALTRRVTEVAGHPTVTQWKVFLHHNEHEHGEPPVIANEAIAIISPIHSATETYYFRVQLTVTDDLGASVVREARLFPNVANIAPQLAWSDSLRALTAGPAPQILDPAAALADADSPGIEGGELRVTLTGGVAGDALSIAPEGDAAGAVNVVGSNVLVGGVVIAAVSGGIGVDSLSVRFNEAATPAAARAILQRVAGKFGSAGARAVTASLNDGDGGTGVSARLALDVEPAPNVPPSIRLTTPADASTFSAPASIAIEADARDTDGTVAKVEFFAGATRIGSVSAPPFRFVWSGMKPAGYALTARATDNSGAVSTSAVVNVSVTGASPLPAPWMDQDIGTVAIAGRALDSTGTFTVKSAGLGLAPTGDEMHIVWQPFNGDCKIVARVDSIRAATTQSFAGLTFRESLLPNARQVTLQLNASRNAAMKWRDGVAAQLQRTPALPLDSSGWLKLVRRGAAFTGYISNDGVTWTLVGTANIPMPADCIVGLVASAVNSAPGDLTARTTAVFSNIKGPLPLPPAP